MGELIVVLDYRHISGLIEKMPKSQKVTELKQILDEAVIQQEGVRYDKEIYR